MQYTFHYTCRNIFNHLKNALKSHTRKCDALLVRTAFSIWHLLVPVRQYLTGLNKLSHSGQRVLDLLDMCIVKEEKSVVYCS